MTLCIKPTFILVLGDRLWKHLPDLGRIAGDRIPDASRTETWNYPIQSTFALAYGIQHPSRGFNGRKWNQHVQNAMTQAKGKSPISR